MSVRKQELLAYKQKLLQDINYYEKRIIEARSAAGKTNTYEIEESSDSDTDFSVHIKSGPSISSLKQERSLLETCLQATQELTSLEVVSSEVNIMVQDPVFVCEPAVTEVGTWSSVVAECCIDLVPFSISFYVHQPNRKFASKCYRGLRVAPSKPAHAAELAASVLPNVRLPSDAVEVVRNYARAHRSRRSTLARLAEQFGDALLMTPLEEGGYMLKVEGILEMSWRLHNKWSPVKFFHNRLTLDLEYMDESYLKIITHAYRQLSNPKLDTQVTTHLIAGIISTCLEAKGPTQELYDSLSSDPEAASKLRKRRTTLNQEPEESVTKKSKKDSQVMAPPKSVPKKSKPKGKDNTIDNRKSATEVITRTKEDGKDLDNAKKTKASDIGKETSSRGSEKSANINKQCNVNNEKSTGRKNSVATIKNKDGTANEKVSTSKNNVATSKNKINDVFDGNQVDKSDKLAVNDKLLSSSTKSGSKHTDIAEDPKKNLNAVKKKTAKNNAENRIESAAKTDARTAEKITEKTKSVTSVKNSAGVSDNIGKDVAKPKKKGAGSNVNSEKNVEKNKNTGADTEKKPNSGKRFEKNKIKPNSEGNVVDKEKTTNVVEKTQRIIVTDKIASGKNDAKIKQVASTNSKDLANLKTIKESKSVENLKKNNNLNEAQTTKNKVTEKNVASENIVPKTASNKKLTGKCNHGQNTNKPNNNLVKSNKVKPDNIKKKLPLNNLNRPKIASEIKNTGNTNKKMDAGITEKENGDQNKAVSKIPPKKFTSNFHLNAHKNVPHRVSPRNVISKANPPRVGSSVKPGNIQKPITTNIPSSLLTWTPEIHV